METITTLIEFAESSNPGTNTSSTGDPISIAVIFAAVLFAVGTFVFVKLRNKSLVTGNHVPVNANTKFPAIFVVVAAMLLAFGLISSINKANAAPTSIAQASEKVYAVVDSNTGTVCFDTGFIKSNVADEVHVVASELDLIEAPEITSAFSWNVKVDDQVIYNGVAGQVQTNLYVEANDSTTSFEISNLSAEAAKSLIGKQVAKVNFTVTTYTEDQLSALSEMAESGVSASETIDKIPNTSLLDEDRDEFYQDLEDTLNDTNAKIVATKDPDALAEFVATGKGGIEAIVLNAKVNADVTVERKFSFIEEQRENVAALKASIAGNEWLLDSDKTAFNNEISVIETQDIPHINAITTKAELDAQETEIPQHLASINDSVQAKAAEREAEYRTQAKSYVAQIKGVSITNINALDNLSTGVKTTYTDKIDAKSAEARASIDAAETKAAIKEVEDSFLASTEAIIAEATTQAYRPWVLNTWTPETDITIGPGSNTNLTVKASVSNEDPNIAYAPSPVYYISETSYNNDYFELTTTSSGYANLTVKNTVPYGNYSLSVYAQFASVTDYGYVTNTENITLIIHVDKSNEYILEDNIHKQLGWDGEGQIYLLSDGGTELYNYNAWAGDTVSFYFSAAEGYPDWSFQLFDGHWSPMLCDVSHNDYDLEGHTWRYNLTLTDEILQRIYNAQGWGGSFVIQGQSLFIEKVTLTRKAEILLADYSSDPLIADGWADQPFCLSDGGAELQAAGAKVGDYVNFYIDKIPTTPSDEYWLLEIMEGHWHDPLVFFCNICETGYPTAEAEGRTEHDLSIHHGAYSLKLTQEILDYVCASQGWGGSFILNGDNTMCTKVTLTRDPL